MNNYAISSDGIATALQDSASALMEAGNNLEQSVALVAAANKVVQDPNSVGSALRTISLRLRGTSVSVLEEMGEETDGVVESVSKMQKKIQALTGVNILTDSGAYKETYTILSEIGQVWEDMSDIDQAALLELMAGKNRANTLAAILGNMKDLEGAYESALNAEGSALKENQAYLDSIQGRIDLFNNSVQTMWMNLIDSEVIKSIVDLGTELIKLVDTLGLIPTALAVFAGFTLLKQPIGLIGEFNNLLKGTITLEGLATAATQAETLAHVQESAAVALADTVLVKYAITSGLVTAEQVAQMTATELLGVAFMGLAAKIQTAAAALWTFLTTTPLGWAALAVAAIAGVITAYEHFTISHEEYIEQLEKETEALKEVQSELKNVQSELETTKDRIDDLNAKETLSFVEQEELDRLKEQNNELERQEKILKDRENRAKEKQARTALDAIKTDQTYDDNHTVVSTTSQNNTYAASQSQSTYSIGMPYAPALQYRYNTDTTEEGEDNTTVNSIENLGNDYEAALKKLKEAQDELAAANRELENAAGLDDTAYDILVQKQTDAVAKVSQYNTELDELFTTWESKYGDVGYFEDPTAEWQKEWNDFVSQYQDWQDQQGLINGTTDKSDILNRVFSSKGADIAKEFKESFESAVQSGVDPTQVIAELLSSTNYAPLLNELQTKFGITADIISGYFTQIGESPVAPIEEIIEGVKTYSTLVTAIETYNEILEQSAEILLDNTEISEDYYGTLKDQLSDITVAEEGFSDAVKEQNGKYIVKNVALLKKLIDQSKKAQQATLKVSKAQAQLEYRELVGQIRNNVFAMAQEYKACGFVTDATMDNISAMREQLETIKETIHQYALLEISMSDAANAYAEYEDAKTRDEQLSYDVSFEEMLKTIDEGLLKNETGTEAFEYAVKAIVPPEFWEDIDDVDEKIKSIHDYIDGNPVFAKLFHVDEESGELDINTDNVREFVNMGFNNGVFVGDDAGDFKLSDEIEGIEDVAEAYGITEAAALALFAALDKVDAKWGDIVTDVMTTPLDRAINESVDEVDEATKALENYLKSVQDGNAAFESNVYNQLVADIGTASAELSANQQAAQDNAKAYTLVQAAVNSFRGELTLTDGEAQNLANNLMQIEGLENLGAITIEDGQLKLTDEQLTLILQKLGLLETPSIMQVQLRYDDIVTQINELQSYIDGAINDPNDSEILKSLNITNIDDAKAKLDELTSEQKEIEFAYKITETSSEEDKSVLESYQELAKNGVNFTVTANTTDAIEDIRGLRLEQAKIKEDQKITFTTNASTIEEAIKSFADEYDRIESKVITLTVNVQKNEEITSSYTPPVKTTSNVRQNLVEALGNARANGSVGLTNAEHDVVVGELGPELVVDATRGVYYTVGNDGTEMVNLPKGAIIYNHKQTEELLRNGHTTRGKYTGGLSFAQGNAHGYGIPSYHPNTEDNTSFDDGTDVNTDWDDAASTLSDALDDAADSVSEFEETIDWIEIRMEEFDERIGMLSAQLENLTTAAEKNAKIDELIATNQQKYSDALAGAKYYEEYAEKYLEGMNSTLVEAAKNGAIAINEFTKEEDEATVNAIQNYREYAQKAADLYQQAEEIVTEIADLAKQAFDNVVNEFDNNKSLIESQISQLEAHNALLETDKGFASEEIYKEIQRLLADEETGQIALLEQQRAAMQAELDSGKIEVGSDAWYEAVNAIAEVDAEIIELKTEVEDLQDSINELHWEQFDLLMKQFQSVYDEAGNLLDILGTKDAVDELGNWTDDGIASLGLLAQQMEAAEMQSAKYAEEIAYLEANWQDLGYTQEEYLAKLEELKSGQYDAINSYHDAKDAILDLNKARVDQIKTIIEDEIDAYRELIEVKKELLAEEKDAYDFQKGVMKQQKNIADIQRKLAALEGDNSASARAQRAKLEAELYEAQAELEETYYDRSIDNQQEALDKELESFEKQKEEEIESWEKYLENLELVVADSLAVVQENTSAVLETLIAMQEQYGLTITETLTKPWEYGAIAIQEYGAKLNISLTELAAMFGLTVDQFAEKLGLTTADLVGGLDITAAQLASTLGLTTEEMAAKLGLSVTDLGGMMDMTIQQLAANIGITLPELAEKLGTTTAGLAGNLDMTMSQFAGKMGLTVDELANKFGFTTADLASKFGMSYQELVNPFGLAMSATVDALKALEEEYRQILEVIRDESKKTVEEVDNAMQKYEDAKEQPPQEKPSEPAQEPKPQSTSVGSKINAGNAKIYADSYGGGASTQYFASDPNYIVLSENNGYVLVRHHKLKSGYTGWFKKSDLPKYASGTLGTKKDQWAILDELGDELQLIPGKNGRLEYVKKGTSIVPADITSNLMEWGELNPQDMLDRNRPAIGAHHIVHNEVNINMNIAEVVHIDRVDNDTLPDLTKAVRKEMDSYMTKVNSAIRSKVR